MSNNLHLLVPNLPFESIPWVQCRKMVQIKHKVCASISWPPLRAESMVGFCSDVNCYGAYIRPPQRSLTEIPSRKETYKGALISESYGGVLLGVTDSFSATSNINTLRTALSSRTSIIPPLWTNNTVWVFLQYNILWWRLNIHICIISKWCMK